mgnify:CR=1 FL=1
MFERGDRIYLKYSGSSKFCQMYIEEVNNLYSIVKIINLSDNTFIYKKFSNNMLSKENNKVEEDIKKGDLVYCIINKVYKEKAIVLDTKDTFVRVMLSESLKQKKISKSNVIVIK